MPRKKVQVAPLIDGLLDDKADNDPREDLQSQLQGQGKMGEDNVEKLATLLDAMTGKKQVRALDGRFSHTESAGPRPPAKTRVQRPESELIKRALQKLAEMKFNLREDDYATGEKAWNIDRFSRKDSQAYGKRKPPVKKVASAALLIPGATGLGYAIGGDTGATIGAGAGFGASAGANLPWLVAALHPRLRGKMLGAAGKRLRTAGQAAAKYTQQAARTGKVSPRKALGLKMQEHARIPGDMYKSMITDPASWAAYGGGLLGGGIAGGIGTAATMKAGSFEKKAFLPKLMQGIGSGLSKAWKAAPRTGELPAMAAGGFGGMLYGSDISGDTGYGVGTLGGAAMGAAAMNPRLRRYLMKSGPVASYTAAPTQALQSGIAGSYAGSGIDLLGGATLGTDTNFGRIGALAGTGLGATRQGLLQALRGQAAKGAVNPTLKAVYNNTTKADMAVNQFGAGTMQPFMNAATAIPRWAFQLAGKKVPEMFQATNPTTVAQAAGQIAGYGTLGGMGLGMAYGGLRGQIDEAVQDNVARAYHDIKGQAGYDLRNALGLGQGSTMSGMLNLADQALMQFGMDPSQYSGAQKLQMLLGTVGGVAGYAGGSPLMGALGMGAAALPLVTGGSNQYANNPLLDQQTGNQLTGRGWY